MQRSKVLPQNGGVRSTRSPVPDTDNGKSSSVEISEVIARIADGMDQQNQALAEAVSETNRLASSLKQNASQAESVSVSAEENSSAITEMAASIEQVTANVTQVSTAAAQTTASV